MSLRAGEDTDGAIHALGRYFTQDRNRKAVQLQIDGSKAGYLNRRDFFSEDDDQSRLGEAQPFELLGLPEYIFIELACPVEGCNTRVLRIHYNERNAERCSIHPDKMLQVVT
jgi:hypothetical protein